MKVGILGSGDVGKVLAAGFLKHGHEVMIATRTPDKLAEWERKTLAAASAASATLRSSPK